MPENSQATQPKAPHHAHDKGYKQLLSNKQTFLSLLKTFVREEWAADIREDDLVRVEKSYILQDFSEKEADIVYELKSGPDNVIFYCLLELQSTVDYLMPFRLLLYMTEIWRDKFNNTPINEREQKGYRLPAIIPAVLYNGADAWTAAGQFREMLAGHERFGDRLLNFSYILFDVNRYDEDELCQTANLIASVFLLDRAAKRYDEIIDRLRRLMAGLQKLTPEQLQQFAVWLKNVLKPRVSEPLRARIDQILDELKPEEVEAMITNIEITLEREFRQAKQEGEAAGLIRGRQEGWQEGKQEGWLEAKREIARNMLRRGHSPADIRELTGLSAAELDKLTQEMN